MVALFNLCFVEQYEVIFGAGISILFVSIFFAFYKEEKQSRKKERRKNENFESIDLCGDFKSFTNKIENLFKSERERKKERRRSNK